MPNVGTPSPQLRSAENVRERFVFSRRRRIGGEELDAGARVHVVCGWVECVCVCVESACVQAGEVMVMVEDAEEAGFGKINLPPPHTTALG